MNFRRIRPGLWRGLTGYEVQCISDNHIVRYRASYEAHAIGMAGGLSEAQKLCDAHSVNRTVAAFKAAWK